MDKKFEQQMKEQLRGLPRESMRRFAWLCGTRALPLLGRDGNFDYWIEHVKQEDQRQKYLLNVLRALDIASVYTGVVANAFAAANAIDDVNAAFAVAAAVNAAASFALSFAAVNASSSVFAAAFARCGIDIKQILLQDLDGIKYGKAHFHHDTAIYGDIWGNFQQALRDIDCGYWGDWYANLFAKGLVLDDADRAEIDLRLNKVPGEIQEQGAAEVARYVMGLKQGAERLNETRVLILGEKGAGKTSLALRLKNPSHPMPKAEDSTEGVDVVEWTVTGGTGQPGDEINVHIWDFAGHVITHAAHRCFMSERCLYILVLNGRTEGSQSIEYWLEQISNYGGNSPVLVFINIQDAHPVELQRNTLMKDFPSIVGFYQADIDKAGEDFEAFRRLVMDHSRSNPLWKDQKISAPAYKVKEALRRRFNQGNEFISRREFDRIAGDNGVASEEQAQLLKDLRALGICLWYDQTEMARMDMMVLNPSWISHGIYRLINWGMGQKVHELAASEFRKAFAGEGKRYPEEKMDFLFQLMNTYQLAFSMEGQKVFVPLLLPADRTDPESLPDFPFEQRLRMEYQANRALPANTVSRLAVLHAPELNRYKSWRFGALLEWEGTTTLVEKSQHTRSVSVYVKGLRRSEYIGRIRKSLDSIFDDYRNSRPELKIEVLVPEEQRGLLGAGVGGLLGADKLLQSEKQIIGYANAGQTLYIDIPGFPMIEPQPTIQAYNLTNNGIITMDSKVPKERKMSAAVIAAIITVIGGIIIALIETFVGKDVPASVPTAIHTPLPTPTATATPLPTQTPRPTPTITPAHTNHPPSATNAP